MSGHSFGGMTSIKVCLEDERPKTLVTYDPWLFAYEQKIKNGEVLLKIPHITVNSEKFHPVC